MADSRAPSFISNVEEEQEIPPELMISPLFYDDPTVSDYPFSDSVSLPGNLDTADSDRASDFEEAIEAQPSPPPSPDLHPTFHPKPCYCEGCFELTVTELERLRRDQPERAAAVVRDSLLPDHRFPLPERFDPTSYSDTDAMIEDRPHDLIRRARELRRRKPSVQELSDAWLFIQRLCSGKVQRVWDGTKYTITLLSEMTVDLVQRVYELGKDKAIAFVANKFKVPSCLVTLKQEINLAINHDITTQAGREAILEYFQGKFPEQCNQEFIDQLIRGLGFSITRWMIDGRPSLYGFVVEFMQYLDAHFHVFRGIKPIALTSAIVNFVKTIIAAAATRLKAPQEVRQAHLRAQSQPEFDPESTQGHKIQEILSNLSFDSLAKADPTLLASAGTALSFTAIAAIGGAGLRCFESGTKLFTTTCNHARSLGNLDRGISSLIKFASFIHEKMASMVAFWQTKQHLTRDEAEFQRVMGKLTIIDPLGNETEKSISLEGFVADARDFMDPTLHLSEVVTGPRMHAFKTYFFPVTNMIMSKLAAQKLRLSQHSVTVLLRLTESLKKYFEEHNFAHQPFDRMTPFCVEWFGKPGTGKSATMKRVAKDLQTDGIYPVSGFFRPGSDGTWSFNPALSYMDNFKQQDIILMDEAGAFDGSSTQKECEGIKVLSFLSVNPFITDQASLPNKGIYFDCKAFFRTSNVSHQHVHGMTSSEALWRRRQLLYEMVNESQVCIDPKKWRYRKLHPSKPGQYLDDKILTYDEMLAETIAHCVAWHKAGEAYRDMPAANPELIQQLLLQHTKVSYQAQADEEQEHLPWWMLNDLVVEDWRDNVSIAPNVVWGESEDSFDDDLPNELPEPRLPRVYDFNDTARGYSGLHDADDLPLGDATNARPGFTMSGPADWNAGYLYEYLPRYQERQHKLRNLTPPRISARARILEIMGLPAFAPSLGMVCDSELDFAMTLYVNLETFGIADVIECYPANGPFLPPLASFCQPYQTLFRAKVDHGLTFTSLEEHTPLWEPSTRFTTDTLYAKYPNLWELRLEKIGREVLVETLDAQAPSEEEEITTIQKGHAVLARYGKFEEEEYFAWMNRGPLQRWKDAILGRRPKWETVDEPKLWRRRVNPYDLFMQENSPKHLYIAVLLVSAIGAGFTAYGVYRFLNRKTPFNAESREIHQKHATSTHVAYIANGCDDSPPQFAPGLMMAQASCPQTVAIEGKVKLNQGRIFKVREGENWRTWTSVNTLAVKGREIIVPYHFIGDQRRNYLIVFPGKGKVSVSYSRSDVVKIGRDLALCQLPSTCSEFGNVIKYMPKQGYGATKSFQCSITRPEITGTQLSFTTIFATAEPSTQTYNLPGGTGQVTLTGLTLKAANKPGDCGSLVYDHSTGCTLPLVGYHVAGHADQNIGLAHMLYQELFEPSEGEPAPEEPTPTGEPTSEYEPQGMEEKQSHPFPEGCIKQGLEEFKYTVYSSSRTRHRKTPLNGRIYPDDMATPPFNLKHPLLDPEVKAAGIEPLVLAEKKFFVPKAIFKQEEREFAKSYSQLCIMDAGPSNRQSLLTEFEMLNGFGPGEGLDRINISSIPGVTYRPLVQEGKRGKRWFIAPADPKDYENSPLVIQDNEGGRYLKNDLIAYESQLRAGVVPFYRVGQHMKDEVLPIEKVRAGRVRLFNSLDLPILLLTRKYFGSYIAAMYKHRANHSTQVGTNPLGHDWTVLHDYLRHFGDDVIAGDYSKYDGQLAPGLMEDSAEDINVWYQTHFLDHSTMDDVVRRTLMKSFIQSNIVSGNLLYQKEQGIPSGVPITAPLNSDVNRKYLIIAIRGILIKAGKYYTPEELLKRVRMGIYGDDFILAVHDELKPYINFETLQAFFASRKIVITPDTKDGTVYHFKKLDNDVTFLKRRFRPHDEYPHLIQAPLDLRSIGKITNWMTKCPEMEVGEQTRENLETVIREMFQHGPNQFGAALSQINKGLASYWNDVSRARTQAYEGIPRYLPNTYKQLDEEWRHGCHGHSLFGEE